MTWNKAVVVCLALFCICSFFIYRSNYYQAIFGDDFYSEIFSASFDVTEKGAAIRVPLKFKYKTRYGLYIKIPEYNRLSYVERTKGFIKYKFISDGLVLKSGETVSSDQWVRLWKEGGSYLDILDFDLPLSGASKNLVLELTVVEPFNFFIPFSGDTYCVVKPNASFK